MGGAIQQVLAKVGDPGVAGLVLLLAVGGFCCFLGSRYFRFSAGVAGFLAGTELVGQLSMRQGWGSLTTTLLGLLGGAVLAALFVVFTLLAAFGLGAALWATMVSLAAGAAGARVDPLLVVLAAFIGGFGAIFLRQFVAVVATSFYGALLAMAALFALVEGRRASFAIATAVSPGATGRVVLYLLCVTILVTAGIIVQSRFGKNPRTDGK